MISVVIAAKDEEALLAATLAEAGVDVSPLRRTGQARTMLAFVSLAADGEREFLFYRSPSADMLFAPEDVDEAAIRGVIEPVVDRTLDDVEQVRAKAVAAVDSRREVERLATSCSHS